MNDEAKIKVLDDMTRALAISDRELHQNSRDVRQLIDLFRARIDNYVKASAE